MTLRRARQIQAAACQHFGLERDELLGDQRHRSFVEARWIAMYLCRNRLGLSFPEIGLIFGNRDHSSILYACRNVTERLALQPALRANLKAVEALITEAA